MTSAMRELMEGPDVNGFIVLCRQPVPTAKHIAAPPCSPPPHPILPNNQKAVWSLNYEPARELQLVAYKSVSPHPPGSLNRCVHGPLI
mmetsp:Transcript_53139/g.94834  ORF Transcript_53139/g.94834 Transcript_53139/m.94834 type:complete len:88 (+) Transcript_53139:91-354(+)